MNNSIIKFICEDKDTTVLYPPVPASKVVPQWYKDIPVELKKLTNYIDADGVPSVKRCIPVLDYLTSGYVLANSWEIIVKPEMKEGIHSFSLECNREKYVGAHPWHQAPVEIDNNKFHYFKINQQWMIKTPPGYSSLIYQPHYLFNKKYKMLPAIVDTDKHNDFIGLIGHVETDKEFNISPGEPLVVVFPFKREEWASEISFDPYVGKDTSFKYYLQGIWHGFYQKYFHSKKSYR